jgi:hypothetical protein
MLRPTTAAAGLPLRRIGRSRTRGAAAKQASTGFCAQTVVIYAERHVQVLVAAAGQGAPIGPGGGSPSAQAQVACCPGPCQGRLWPERQRRAGRRVRVTRGDSRVACPCWAPAPDRGRKPPGVDGTPVSHLGTVIGGSWPDLCIPGRSISSWHLLASAGIIVGRSLPRGRGDLRCRRSSECLQAGMGRKWRGA